MVMQKKSESKKVINFQRVAARLDQLTAIRLHVPKLFEISKTRFIPAQW